MAVKELPTILLIPGACTTPACYDWLASYLEKRGSCLERCLSVGLLLISSKDFPSKEQH